MYWYVYYAGEALIRRVCEVLINGVVGELMAPFLAFISACLLGNIQCYISLFIISLVVSFFKSLGDFT